MGRVIVEARRFLNTHFPISELRAESKNPFSDHFHPVSQRLSIRRLHLRAAEIMRSGERRSVQAETYSMEALTAVAELRQDRRYKIAMDAHPLVGNQYWLLAEGDVRERRAQSARTPQGFERVLRRIL